VDGAHLDVGPAVANPRSPVGPAGPMVLAARRGHLTGTGRAGLADEIRHASQGAGHARNRAEDGGQPDQGAQPGGAITAG